MLYAIAAGIAGYTCLFAIRRFVLGDFAAQRVEYVWAGDPLGYIKGEIPYLFLVWLWLLSSSIWHNFFLTRKEPASSNSKYRPFWPPSHRCWLSILFWHLLSNELSWTPLDTVSA